LSKRFTHSPPLNPSEQMKELIVMKTIITTEFIRTICPKVSFSNLFSLAAIVCVVFSLFGMPHSFGYSVPTTEVNDVSVVGAIYYS